jgi:hypothetical protein
MQICAHTSQLIQNLHSFRLISFEIYSYELQTQWENKRYLISELSNYLAGLFRGLDLLLGGVFWWGRALSGVQAINPKQNWATRLVRASK